MARKGTYTKHPSKAKRGQNFLRRQWQKFQGLSRPKKALVVASPFVAFLILAPVITYVVMWRDISDPERLMNRSNTGIELLDRNGQVFFSTSNNNALKRLQLNEISNYVEKAVVSSEDKNFYKHGGVSFRGILAAMYANVANGDPTAYGSSTLTQQLVKNKLLSSEKSYLRKYLEVFMAMAVDKQYSKDEILDMYLNSVDFGVGGYGIDEAAHTYFNKNASDLDLAQSAMLIGLLPAPNAYSPVTGDATKAKERQKYVLNRMVDDGKITKSEASAALAETLQYAEIKPVEYTHAPHFTEMIISDLYKKYGEDKVKRSGYKVKTTLDLGWQTQAEDIVTKQQAINAPLGGRNASVTAIDPKTGEVRVLVGSYNYDDTTFGKVNMATTPRQPGSSFKPIYYAEAINEKLITPATVVTDEPTDFDGWKPNNFDFKFRGDITLRNALAESLNIPAAKVMQKLGVSKAIDKAREMGLTTIDPKHDYGLPLSLGSAEVREVDMVNAYAAFADQGRQHDMTTITSIQNKYGDTIYKHSGTSKRVQSTEASFVISDMLSDNNARASSFGTRLNIPGRKVAVKTGSTDENRDAWTIGYTPSIAVGVWVGNNENEVMTSGGSMMAGPIWVNTIEAILGNSPAETFTQPGNVVKTWACTATGGSYQDFFIKGTEPTNNCHDSSSSTNTSPQPQQTTKDSDGDGVIDSEDKCPSQAADTEDGCPATKPTDSDNDGVPDSTDACSNTPTGTSVDSTGCPVTTQPPPSTTDSDGDGVPDTTDKCPGTPAGTTVDSTGCAKTTTSPPTGGTTQQQRVLPRG